MRKLEPARVSYLDDFLISYRVYMMVGLVIPRYLKVHFILIKYTCHSRSQTLRMRYPFQSTGRPISHRSGWEGEHLNRRGAQRIECSTVLEDAIF